MKKVFDSFLHQATVPLVIVMSLVVAVSGPLATVNAQYYWQQSLTTLKEKINTAIDTSLSRLSAAQTALNTSISVNNGQVTYTVTGPHGSATGTVTKDGASGSVTSSHGTASGSVSKDGASGEVHTTKGGSASGSVTKDGVTVSGHNASGDSFSIDLDKTDFAGKLSVPQKLKDKLKEANATAIDKLKALQAKAKAANTLEKAKAVAKEYDSKFQEFAVANVQARITKSIDTLTKVLDSLQLGAAMMQTRVDKLKECIETLKASGASANVSVANGTASVTATGCSTLNLSLSKDQVEAVLQAKLDKIKSSMQTMRSFLSSSIGLIDKLKDYSYHGTLDSFGSISAQLDIVIKLGASVKDTLVSLSGSVNKA